jgi:raffinose/stachyose/melibiose transport system substrate-binding protein
VNYRSLVRVLGVALVLALLPALSWAAPKIVMRMGDNLTDRQNTWGAVVEQINADFTKAHPDVSFETESYPDQPYQEKIKLYATSGQLPDVMKYWSLPSMLKPMVDAKLAAELPAADFKALNFVPGSLEVNMIG